MTIKIKGKEIFLLRYLGSVRFFKHLILSLAALLIIALAAGFIWFASIQNSNDGDALPNPDPSIDQGLQTGPDAEITNPSLPNPFVDVNTRDWFYDYVIYAYANGIMGGTHTDPMRFNPDRLLTHGEFVTILYRNAGSPEVNSTDSSFEGIEEGAWFTDPVKWAAESGILIEFPGIDYNPDNIISKQDLAAILTRYAEYMASPLPDDWGYEDLTPGDQATRADAAAMLQRFSEAAKQ
jgi:hypothetical protein